MKFQPYFQMLSEMFSARERQREAALERGDLPPVFNSDTVWDSVPADMLELLDKLP